MFFAALSGSVSVAVQLPSATASHIRFSLRAPVDMNTRHCVCVHVNCALVFGKSHNRCGRAHSCTRACVRHIQAYTHALDSNHRIFINLKSAVVYCLPDNYIVDDVSLEDVKFQLNPTYSKSDCKFAYFTRLFVRFALRSSTRNSRCSLFVQYPHLTLLRVLPAPKMARISCPDILA